MDEDFKNVARELMLEELMSWGYCDQCPYYKDKNCTVDDNITKGRCFQEWVNFDCHCVCHYYGT